MQSWERKTTNANPLGTLHNHILHIHSMRQLTILVNLRIFQTFLACDANNILTPNQTFSGMLFISSALRQINYQKITKIIKRKVQKFCKAHISTFIKFIWHHPASLHHIRSIHFKHTTSTKPTNKKKCLPAENIRS